MRPSVGTIAIAGIAAAGLFILVADPLGTRGGGHSMAPPDTAGIAEGAAIAQVVVPASLSDAEIMGKRAFDAVCAACHGENAGGRNGMAPPLVHKIYEPSHHGDGAFLAAVQNGVTSHHWRFGSMPAIEGLSRADVANIVAYVRRLQRENGIT